MKLLRRLFQSCYLSVRRRREHKDAMSRREATLQPDHQQQGSQVYTNVWTIWILLKSFGLENCPNKMSITLQDLVEECRKSDIFFNLCQEAQTFMYLCSDKKRENLQNYSPTATAATKESGPRGEKRQETTEQKKKRTKIAHCHFGCN